MSITFGAKPTVPALLSLIHALRAIKTTIRLYHSGKSEGTQFTQSKICIRLAQMALSSLESEHRKLFQSEIELVTSQLLTFDNLPDDLLRLAPLLGHIVCADQTSHQPILARAMSKPK
ncbi:MAG: hypothetical protein NWR44_02180 [Alphaproteobacteria bacterium]|jgi:hypothetical protein|nr:hypothetical protein [Alphaproteobacteria bacterium]